MFLTIKYKNGYIYIANESGKKERIEVITNTMPPRVFVGFTSVLSAKRLITKLESRYV